MPPARSFAGKRLLRLRGGMADDESSEDEEPEDDDDDEEEQKGDDEGEGEEEAQEGEEAGEEAGVRVEDAALETDCQQLYKLFGEAILPFVPTAYARLNIAPC